MLVLNYFWLGYFWWICLLYTYQKKMKEIMKEIRTGSGNKRNNKASDDSKIIIMFGN